MDNNIDIMLNKIIKSLLVTVISITLIIVGIFIIPVQYSYAAVSEIPYFSSYPDFDDLSLNGFAYAINNSNKYAYCGSDNSASRVAYITTTNQFLFFCPSTETDKHVYYSTLESYQVYRNTMMSSMNGYNYFTLNVPNSPKEIYVDSYQTIADALADYNNISTPQGTFATFPQVSFSTEIDYAEIAAQGAFIYTGINTYSFLGQYESSSAPVSQYCYVQTGENSYTAVVFSSVPLTVYKAFINGQTYTYSVCEQYDEGKYCYSFNQFSTLDDISPLVPFASLTDAKEAFTGATSGSGSASGVVSAGALTYQVPAGNVLYVRVRPGSIASVTADMPVISSTTSPYWLESQINTMWASGVAGLPSSNTVFPLSNMTRINFGLDPSVGTDGYGRSFSAYASHAPFNGGWFVVYNPAYTKTIIPGRTDLMSINPTVTVKCQFALEYYMYPLSETLTVDGGTSSNSTGYTDSWSGQYDPDNDNFEDTSTITNETPTSGGEQAPTINQNNMDIGGYIQEIKKTLDNFVESLSQLLTAPISHIQKLITYASNFMASISQFFTWLPEPVYTVIIGALVVAVVIGILKLLF